MVDPLFWLGLSLLLVATSLMSVLLVAIPALRELARAARSAEKLFDTLNRELPPTLEAIRLTGLELTDLTDDVSESVQHAGKVIQQVDQSMTVARDQAKQLQVGGQSFLAGVKAAWKAWSRPVRHTSSSLRPSSQPTSRKQEPRLRKPKRASQSPPAPPLESNAQSSRERLAPTSQLAQPSQPGLQPSKRSPLRQPIEQSLKQNSDKQALSTPLPLATPEHADKESSLSPHPSQESQDD
ncbi:MAG TPA: hypothetical protein V6D07_04100 [Trichocoleus sp.]